MNTYPDLSMDTLRTMDRLSLERIAREASGRDVKDMTPSERDEWIARAAAYRCASVSGGAS